MASGIARPKKMKPSQGRIGSTGLDPAGSAGGIKALRKGIKECGRPALSRWSQSWVPRRQLRPLCQQPLLCCEPLPGVGAWPSKRVQGPRMCSSGKRALSRAYSSKNITSLRRFLASLFQVDKDHVNPGGWDGIWRVKHPIG